MSVTIDSKLDETKTKLASLKSYHEKNLRNLKFETFFPGHIDYFIYFLYIIIYIFNSIIIFYRYNYNCILIRLLYLIPYFVEIYYS